MVQGVTAGNSRRTADEQATQYDVEPVESPRSDGVPSHLGERFGTGLSAAIFLGAVVGVAVTWALGASTLLPLFVALGLGFALSPVAGLLAVELSD
ncbi:hypothetical protein C474_00932 [Halogeometricum pallidum JCM 14848]|uniref:Glycine zipper-like domain-containing protein n=1 Tax=Halogeometricum pallidum JCM 14848 TaxID=1227487 RepID=M0DH96_HALPD|nr:hypothetical protein [Halogeometricum pallidum]ELZ34881.1 hypothetical protein C474_00932 [Halogeometricum pallidum JCM 14848]